MLSPDSTPHHSATWALDKIKKLVELWRANVLSPGEIAAALGVTRNAVIGKANRMHLEAKKIGRPRAARFAATPRPAPKPADPPPPPEAPLSLGLTIYELAAAQCRYAEGDGPPYLFCGHAVQEGSPYCPYHHRVCYFPLSPARRELAQPLSEWRGARY